MKRVLVVFTGGTISSGFTAKDIKGPRADVSAKLHDYVASYFHEKDVEVTCCEPWGVPGLDSSELTPVHWVHMTTIIAEELEKGVSGVLILHGTDTMAWSSAWLSLCFSGAGVPVVLTGSQLTLDYTPEDVTVNLRGAAQVVCSGINGVWIYCNWKLIPGARAHKARALHPDAFAPIGSIPLYFSPDWAQKGAETGNTIRKCVELSDQLKSILQRKPREIESVCSRVGWLVCQPGVYGNPSGKEDILVIWGYGSGNAEPAALAGIKTAWSGKRKPQVIACSQAEGDIKNPVSYGDVGIASLTSDGFVVWGQMDYPVEFIHALACFSLLADPGAPEKILSRFLKRYEPQ